VGTINSSLNSANRLYRKNNMVTKPANISNCYDFFVEVRSRTLQLIKPLTPEDACAQSMPDASPAKWHLAHTSWFYETFILENFELNFSPYNKAFRDLFNSYYNGIGEQYTRGKARVTDEAKPRRNPSVRARRYFSDSRIGIARRY
jgi:hypothetical protein